MRKINTSIIISICVIFFMSISFTNAQGFLKTNGKKIINDNDDNYILKGIGLGGWMVKEGYMMQTNNFANPQHEIHKIIVELIGKEKAQIFFDAWLKNYCTRQDIDSIAKWGFNSIRLPLHYNLFTPAIEDEPVQGEITWMNKGFEMVDNILDWCEANQIYLILDLHAAPGGQGHDGAISDYNSSKPSLWESDANKEKTIALWRKLADKYKDETWIGGYDLINETNWSFENKEKHGTQDTKNIPLKELMVNITNAIREVDNNHIIFIEGNSWANNFNGMKEPWDENMAYSFHKYWSYTTQEDVQWILTLRDKANVPIWLGEAGENSNVWFKSCIEIMENNNIGWAWWPYKKIDSKSGIHSITKTKGYEKLLKYWDGQAVTITAKEATTTLMELTENLKLDNCEINVDVIDAMIRQPNDYTTKPFKNHEIPGRIFASDYDLGQLNVAYYDLDTADYHVNESFTAWNSGWEYRNDAVDIEPCSDNETNGYNVGWTNAGEWMQYTVEVNETGAYNLEVRYATDSNDGQFHLEVDGINVTGAIATPRTNGWQNWETITIQDVIIEQGKHSIKFVIDKTGFNFNYINLLNPISIATITSKFINAETTATGNNIILTSNKKLNTIESLSVNDFEIISDNQNININSIEFDASSEYKIILSISEKLGRNDILKLNYNGTTIKTIDNNAVEQISEIDIVNYSPVYLSIPKKIQAEDYIINKGFQNENCSDTGLGINLGYTNKGDYLDYNIEVTENKQYKVEYRVASAYSNGKFELQLIDGDNVTTLHSMNIASTGGWQTWKTISEIADLTVGKYTLRMLVKAGEYNFNWFKISEYTATSISEINTENLEIKILNNPTSKYLTFSSNFSSAQYANVKLINIQGQTFLNENISLSDGVQQLDISTLTKGVYIFKVISNSKIFSEKIIVY